MNDLVLKRIRWLLLVAAVAVCAADGPTPEQLVQEGHWKRARAALEPLAQAKPNDAQTAYLLSRVKTRFGELGAALHLAEKAAAFNPRNAEYRYQVGAVVAEKARKERSFGLARRVKREFEAVLALDPKHLDARTSLIQFHLQAPWIVGGSGKTARRLAEEVTRLDAARGFLEQARIASDEKKYDQLESLYLKALAANPQSYQVLITLAGFYSQDQVKQYALAEKYAREAQKIEPGRVGPYAALAAALAGQQRYQELDALLGQAEKNVPDDLSAYYQAARVLLEGQELARAEKYFYKYLTQDPEPTAPTQAHGHWRLGQLYEKQGKKNEAVAEFRTALRLKPDLKEAKDDLKRVS